MSSFFIEKKIYYHDTDCGGVVYYANYLKHLEEARTEFCYSLGIDLKKLSEKGILFAVVHLEINYKAPARYQDTVSIFTNIEKIKRVSLQFFQEIKKENITILIANTTWVCINNNFKSRSIPHKIRQLFVANI